MKLSPHTRLMQRLVRSLIRRYQLHAETSKMVAEFTHALAANLRAAELKHGYSDNWRTDDWEGDCRLQLVEHVAKGDPLDVAAYCAFMHARGWSTSLNGQQARPSVTMRGGAE